MSWNNAMIADRPLVSSKRKAIYTSIKTTDARIAANALHKSSAENDALVALPNDTRPEYLSSIVAALFTL